VSAAPHGPAGLGTFDHLVVLMLENRSFDNLLGWLYEHDAPAQFLGRGEPRFRGVAGLDLGNDDGLAPTRRVPVGKAPYATADDMCQPCPDPGEYYNPHVIRQLFDVDVKGAVPPLTGTPSMSGFVKDYIASIVAQEALDGVTPGYDRYKVIMDCFPPEALPVLNGLARQFAVSDEWFCSVPSQTFCNRSFFHSAQSHGFVHNSDYIKWVENAAPTVFEQLGGALGAEKGWRVYWDEADLFPLTRLLHDGLRSREHDANFRHYSTFADDCARGDLPAYTFIQPRIVMNHNDMHPPIVLNQDVHSSALAGELLVNAVYDAVRTSSAWMRTMLVITFDEHGGTYDHWPPPMAVPPCADAPWPLEFGFAFDRLGVRVPTIFISPFIAPGTVVRAEGDVPFDHTSLIRTLGARWNLPPLTARDAAAPVFAHVATLGDAEARRETPAMQPRPYTPVSDAQAHESLLNGMQLEFGRLASHLLGRGVLGDAVKKVVHLLEALR
jgi:phospholipase C